MLAPLLLAQTAARSSTKPSRKRAPPTSRSRRPKNAATQGVEPQPGERIGSAAGGSRPTEQYLGRQLQLEHEVELARKRYEAAQKRWNDLK